MLNPPEILKPLECNTDNAARIQLAALCRLLEHYGWSDIILNHASARAPADANLFLMNPFGLRYGEITSSNLVKVNFQGQAVDENQWPVNQAGVVLHSAIYQARPDIKAIIHTHTPYGVAVASLECGLQCHDQMALLFHDKIGYHDFEGIAVNEDEQQRIMTALGNNTCLILRNHGLVATGASIAEAFWNYYYLEFACRVQIHTMSTGAKLYPVSEEIKKHTFNQHQYFGKDKAPVSVGNFPGNFDLMFAALMRMLDAKDGSYRD